MPKVSVVPTVSQIEALRSNLHKRSQNIKTVYAEVVISSWIYSMQCRESQKH